MATLPQALVFYPGLGQYESCTATMAIGKTPSVIQLQVPPTHPEAVTIKSRGDLVIQDGRDRVKFVDCQVDSSSFQYDDSGMVSFILLRDFRWRWKYPTISGEYNIRNDKAQIVKREKSANSNLAIENSERDCRQLATMCLEALGVSRFNVSRMDGKPRPYVNWYYTNAADALQEVCDACAAIICAQPDGSVTIEPYTQGRQLPIARAEQYSRTFDPPELPYAIQICCGPTRYQADLKLLPIGKDTDGTWKEIDDLSYTPTGGWVVETDILEFANIKNLKHRELAKATVWKCFWVEAPLVIQPYGNVTYREQLELEPEQVAQLVTDARVINQVAIVYGIWDDKQDATRETVAEQLGVPETDLPNWATDNLDQLAAITIPVAFNIETDSNGVSIVRFSEPITRPGENSEVLSPVLYLRCAVKIRNPENRDLDAHKVKRVVNSSLKREGLWTTRSVIHNEIQLAHETDGENNQQEVDKECNYYIDALLREYLNQSPESAPYVGIIPIAIDGAIQSVTWMVTNDGPTTIINRNQDNGSPVTPGYRERYRNEQLKKLIDGAYSAPNNYITSRFNKRWSTIRIVKGL